jgi:cell division septation protein DedD
LPKLELIARSSGTGYTSSTPASSPESGAGSGWAVQVGSFSVEENAYQLRNRLHARDFPVSVEQVVVNGRTLHRVQVGPQASRAESETIRERLRREANIEGQVVSLDN